MPRKARIDAPGALHHVIARGIARKKIFYDDVDRDFFIERLGTIKYKQARIFQFMNFWQSKDVDNFAYVVEIRETPLSQSHVLSASDRWEK